MSQNLCNELSIRMINGGWQRAEIGMVGNLYAVSATDPHGREHGGARKTPEALVEYLMGIGAIAPKPQSAPTPTISDGLAALLDGGETLADGKGRLLVEYDVLTQRLHDERYEMSRAETGRHEAISAILLELRS